MSIRAVVTAGYGNGTFSGTIKDVTLRGYSIGGALVIQIYTANIIVNITPTLSIKVNITPTRNIDANDTPAREVVIG